MKSFILIVALLLLGDSSLLAQTDPPPANKKAQEAYDKAMLQLRDGLVRDAIPLLGKAIEYDPNYVDAYLSMAGVYGELKDYQKCVDYYELARAKDSAYFRYYELPYSIDLAGLGRFDSALAAVNDFLSIPKLADNSIKSGQYRKRCYEFAIDYAKKHPAANYSFAPVNMGDSINSSTSEYYPSFTIDDSTFVFTRRGERGREDIIESKLLPDGKYSKAKLIDGSINLQPFKGAINISQDGEWLLFAGDFPGKGDGDFDIFISYNTPNGWSEPMNMGYSINSEFWDSSPSLSPDKNTLYFSSNRPGGYGGSDLYVSHRRANGTWTPAENMGPTINTKGDEQAPFIHADNQTLYFTSNGLPGYGGSDIYVTHKTGDTWSTPENLGYPINTIENEGSLFVASDGLTAYYASDRADTKGQLDLYTFTLQPDVRPTRTLYVQGYVTDAATGKYIPCSVELTDDSTQHPVTKLQTDETGFYFMTLPVGKDYTFTINRKGYLFYSDVFRLKEKAPDSTYIKNIQLQPITLNATVALKNIQFDLNSYQLKPVSLTELDKLLELMTDNPTVHVQISGYTDNIGNDADNLTLSTNRAKAVAEYLMSKGIGADRLTWKGYGAAKPIADNSTEEGRAKNRRTAFTITGL
ncbi:MAG TPA: OmpA family protein [Chitinophagaceae bacterium]|nr:OmpA family protein [Chitinophagaceae bacterium]